MTGTEVLALGALGVALLSLLFAAIACDATRERERLERAARRPILAAPRRATLEPVRPIVAPIGRDPFADHRPGCGCVHHR